MYRRSTALTRPDLADTFDFLADYDMPTLDPRIDAYIAKAPAFAKPILEKVRAAVHEGCPDCEETLKWGHPSFVYNGIMCGVAAHKKHCGLHFWQSGRIVPADERDEAWTRLAKLESESD